MTTHDFPVRPAGATRRLLRVYCTGCSHTMGYVFLDEKGHLWLATTDRLYGSEQFVPTSPDAGRWWTSHDIDLLDDDEAYLYSGCTKGGPRCGHAYSWQLKDARGHLDTAMKEGRVVKFAL